MADEHEEQAESYAETGKDHVRLGNEAEEPTEPGFLGPGRDGALDSGEKGERSADAVNAGAIQKIVAQIKTERLLGAAAGGDDDVGRPAFFDLHEESMLCTGLMRGDDSNLFVASTGKLMVSQPGGTVLGALRCEEPQDGVFFSFQLEPVEQASQIMQPGDAGHSSPAKSPPGCGYQTAIQQDNVGLLQGMAVSIVGLKLGERG